MQDGHNLTYEIPVVKFLGGGPSPGASQIFLYLSYHRVVTELDLFVWPTVQSYSVLEIKCEDGAGRCFTTRHNTGQECLACASQENKAD